MPIVNHDNNQHGADENIRLGNLWDGIALYAGLMARLGPVWDDWQTWQPDDWRRATAMGSWM